MFVTECRGPGRCLLLRSQTRPREATRLPLVPFPAVATCRGVLHRFMIVVNQLHGKRRHLLERVMCVIP